MNVSNSCAIGELPTAARLHSHRDTSIVQDGGMGQEVSQGPATNLLKLLKEQGPRATQSDRTLAVW